MTSKNRFRDFVAGELERRQMSARQFADFVGVSPTTITRSIDERDPKTPGLEFLIKLSKATHTSLLTLVEMSYPDVVEETRVSPSAQILAQRIEELPEHLQDAVLTLVQGYKG